MKRLQNLGHARTKGLSRCRGLLHRGPKQRVGNPNSTAASLLRQIRITPPLGTRSANSTSRETLRSGVDAQVDKVPSDRACDSIHSTIRAARSRPKPFIRICHRSPNTLIASTNCWSVTSPAAFRRTATDDSNHPDRAWVGSGASTTSDCKRRKARSTTPMNVGATGIWKLGESGFWLLAGVLCVHDRQLAKAPIASVRKVDTSVLKVLPSWH